MTIYRKDAGIWKPAIIPSVRQAGVWAPLKAGYVKQGGIWKQFYASDPVLTWASSAVTGTDATSHTFASQAISTAASNRFVIVVISTGMDVGGTLTNGHPLTVTIGGVSATKLFAPVPSGGDNDSIMSMWGALVPTGTTASIVMTWNVSQRRVGLATYALYYHTMVPTYTGSGSFNGTTNVSLNVTVGPGGKGLVGLMGGDNSAGTYATTWTGTTTVTEFYDQVVESSSNQAGGTFTTSGNIIGTNAFDADQFALWASWGTPLPGYRYYRWYITETRDTTLAIVQAGEFRLLKDGVDLTAPIAITQPGGFTGTGTESFDKLWNLTSAKWCDTGFGTRGFADPTFDFGAPVEANQWAYMTANDTSGRDPRDFTIQGSNDLSSWTTVHTSVGFLPTTARDTWLAATAMTP